MNTDKQRLARTLVEPLVDRPILHQSQDVRLNGNVNGASLIRVPEWVESRLGNYYLYFAHHEGQSIRLAYANALDGNWTIVWPGALTLADSLFPSVEPKIEDLHEEAQGWIAQGADGLYPHIASPDVIVDEERREIRLYYHGRLADGRQRSRVAISANGIHFTARDEVIGAPYMRMMRHDGAWIGLAMPGYLYRSADGLTQFEVVSQLFENHERHYALLQRGDELIIFWTRIGDAPERIMASVVDMTRPIEAWEAVGEFEVHRPKRTWEGVDLPNVPSTYGTDMNPVNQVRDPAIFEEDGKVYLLYAVQGEQGIGIGRLTQS